MPDDPGDYSKSECSVYDFDLKQRLLDHFGDFGWVYKGILKANGDVIPVPATSTCVTAIFETDAIEELQDLADQLGAEVIEPDHTRQYPDATLTGGDFGDSRIALDVKTARRSHTNSDKLDSPMTLGSYAGYFKKPNEESPWTKFPYGSYDEHWILCFAHYWDDEKDSLNMVSGTETIVDQKWKLASRTSGTGTTSHIGSIKNLSDLRAGNGAFKSEEEFEKYWRSHD